MFGIRSRKNQTEAIPEAANFILEPGFRFEGNGPLREIDLLFLPILRNAFRQIPATDKEAHEVKMNYLRAVLHHPTATDDIRAKAASQLRWTEREYAKIA